MRSDPFDDGLTSSPRRLTISLSQRTLWLAAGVALASLVVVLLVAQAFNALLLIFLAITLAETIRPLVARLERLRVPPPPRRGPYLSGPGGALRWNRLAVANPAGGASQ